MDFGALNVTMNKYPVSFCGEDSIADKGWCYSLWYCRTSFMEINGTSFTKIKE